ncbi:ATP-grasp domain-containing protein [Sporosarcina sp. PTS2304]|uniref:ATP-grasp domain-containing protein n=1 Tax=Sporosarcina sp. PTS2304 TaxID=2283194 RepID=UPI000E0CC4E3|nr:ATP-grasp domain-containing protein [Sporosarcina sp. PTS2304]AXI00022.1 ATP-grasp domain-containing protein [Sporosarcina sp. PTS2304]
MEAIVFLGASTSGSSQDAISATRRLGYKTILMTDRKQRKSNEFYSIDHVVHMESMEREMIKRKIIEWSDIYAIRLLVSFVEPYVSLAASLSNEFCRTRISWRAMQRMEDKIGTRTALLDDPTNCDFTIISNEFIGKLTEQTTLKFPVIIKNPLSTGSKNVYCIENDQDFELAKKKLSSRFPNQSSIVEEYVEGTQYVIEVVVCNGKPVIVAVIQQEITKRISFIVTAYNVLVNMEDIMYVELTETIQSIMKKIGLHHGACHVEMRYTDKGWRLIEINPRISGGAMNRMIEESTGINLVEETIKLYLGETPNFIRTENRPVYTSYITFTTYGYLLKVKGVKQAESSPGVVNVHIKPAIGEIVMPAISMGYRYGYVMAVGKTETEAKSRAEQAIRLIKYYIEPI